MNWARPRLLDSPDERALRREGERAAPAPELAARSARLRGPRSPGPRVRRTSSPPPASAGGRCCPSGLPGAGDSPYSSPSSFAGSRLFVSLAALAAEGLLDPTDLDAPAELGGGVRTSRPRARSAPGGCAAPSRASRRRGPPPGRSSPRSPRATRTGSRTGRCSPRSRTRTAAGPGGSGRRSCARGSRTPFAPPASGSRASFASSASSSSSSTASGARCAPTATRAAFA